MHALVDLLAQNPLLLLFLVAAIGFPLGRLQVRGMQLGVASVLFVGLGFGGLDPRLALPEIVYMLGLALFMYTLGLSSGRAFLASLRGEGLRHYALALGVLGTAAALVAVAQRVVGTDRAHAAGLFAGAVTSTPALASALESLKDGGDVSAPVVAYSIAYPMGVLGVILAIQVAMRLFRVDLAAEGPRLAELGAANEALSSINIEVRHDMGPFTIEELVRGLKWRVIFGRIKRGEGYLLAAPDARLLPGDVVTAVGTATELARVAARLGAASDEPIHLDRASFDLRRIFVSSPETAGRTLRELDLAHRFGAVVTRVRRGDVDLLPDPEMRLELGDRVRVLAPTDRLGEASAFFGDSYRAASEVDILTFGLGLALGLLVGIVPIPLPGGLTLSLGFAGGPLIVALVLGTIERTKGLVWTLPFSANVTLRQIGLILFLAGVGTRTGTGFFRTVASSGGLGLFLAGAAVTFLTALLALTVGYRLMKIPMTVLVGLVAGIHTQAAVLGYAETTTKSDAPSLGYASLYPAATIAKLLLVQVLLAVG
ncbi:MAG TPA: TrkA C-terminal domain-containing protein [Anaeromyxobacteraceae bacterium]|nr:TrkA C-terminal domain-containing protein [Anaeromyxobacteraceae bacterium]